eukprot:SAG31_NODE_736_length_12477_cov_60.959363_12_plen_275_part_00
MCSSQLPGWLLPQRATTRSPGCAASIRVQQILIIISSLRAQHTPPADDSFHATASAWTTQAPTCSTFQVSWWSRIASSSPSFNSCSISWSKGSMRKHCQRTITFVSQDGARLRTVEVGAQSRSTSLTSTTCYTGASQCGALQQRTVSFSSSQRRLLENDTVPSLTLSRFDLSWFRFSDLLVNPKTVPLVQALCGNSFRLDHIYAQVHRPGSHSGGMHEIGIEGGGMYAYDSARGRFQNGMVVVAFELRDIHPGDGGLGVGAAAVDCGMISCRIR